MAEKEEEKEEAPKGADFAAGTAPSNIRLLVCDNYQIDITADGFGICKCGHEKSAHSFPKDGQVCQPAEAARKYVHLDPPRSGWRRLTQCGGLLAHAVSACDPPPPPLSIIKLHGPLHLSTT